MSTTADDLRLSLAIAAQEMAEVVEALRQAEQERDSAQTYATQTRQRNIALSKRIRCLLRSHKHVSQLREHLDALENLLSEFTAAPLTATDHTGEIR
jgi:uncharacterized protein (DUF3084 family)